MPRSRHNSSIRRAALTVFALLLATPAVAMGQWQMHSSGTTASLRGLSVVDARHVWASGSRGTVVRTEDGGERWRAASIPAAESLDIRAIHARGGLVAHAAATAGRIWRTTDGGATWSLRWEARDSSVFLDAIDFWDDRHGIALGDPIDGRFLILLTDDGGETWRESPMESRPVAEPGEAAFAASGSSLVVVGERTLLLGTGGSVARMHHSPDRGRTWTASTAPLIQGSASRGIFSVAALVTGEALLVGGDYLHPDTTRANAALAADGRRFTAVTGAPPRGYRSGVALHGRAGRAALAVAVGPAGSDVSVDGGRSWRPLSPTGFHAVRASPDGIFFATGSDGRIARLDARTLRE